MKHLLWPLFFVSVALGSFVNASSPEEIRQLCQTSAESEPSAPAGQANCLCTQAQQPDKCVCNTTAGDPAQGKCRIGLHSNLSQNLEVENAEEEAKESCQDAYDGVARCCFNPEGCIGAHTGQAFHMMNAYRNMKNPGGGINNECRMINDAMKTNAGHISTMNALCVNKVRVCKNTCKEAIKKLMVALNDSCKLLDSGNPLTAEDMTDDQYDQLHEAMKGEYSSDYTCTPAFFYKYASQGYNKTRCIKQPPLPEKVHLDDITLSEVIKECKSAVSKLKLVTDGLTSTFLALIGFATKCQQATGGVFVPRPGSAPPSLGVPDMPTITNTGGGGSETSTPLSNSGSSGDGRPIDDFDLVDEHEEVSNIPKALPSGAGGLVTGGSQGGSGAPGGGAAGGGAGYGGGGRPKGGTPGGKQKVLKGGYRGSKGFAGYGGGMGGGGGRGATPAWAKDPRGKEKEKERKTASLSLRKLLGKPKKNINPLSKKLGSPHENIFERISNRYHYMCQTKRLHCEGYTGL